jgi:tetratricopeptide (TPR) repeat protein
MGETLNIVFRHRDDGSFELELKEGWSGHTVIGRFVPPYTPRQMNTLQKKLNNLASSYDELRDIGHHLFRALCGSETPSSEHSEAAEQSVQAVLRAVIQRTLKRRGTVALTFIFGPGCDEFVRYPWELLHNGNHFLLVSGIFTLTRALWLPDMPGGGDLPVHPPMRVLYIGASPADCVALETERSYEELRNALTPLIDIGHVFLDRLEPPTFDNLVSYLNSYGGASMLDDNDTVIPCYVVHFDGHGTYGRLCPQDECGTMNGAEVRKCSNCATSLSRVKPQTYLCFCNEEGCNHYIDTQSLRDLFLSSDVHLAVFSACETATLTGEPRRSERPVVDATLATALVTAQVPAVVAMPFSLQDDLSPVFVRHFYEALVDGRTLEEALARARQALLPMQQKSWFIPVLYRQVMENDDGPVPLLALRNAPDEHEHPLAYLGTPEAFIGRTHELNDLDELLTAATSEPRPGITRTQRLRYGTHHFALTGPAGIGKSALAFEAAQRNKAKFPGGIIGVSLQGGKPFADALLEMMDHLHIPTRSTTADASYRARLVLGTLRSLASRELPSLVLLDGFEEVHDALELEAWLRFLSNLPQEVVVLLTSRSNPDTLPITGGNHCRWYDYRVEKMTDPDLFALFAELASASGLDQRIRFYDSRQQAVLREICTLLDGYPLGAELIFGATRSIGGKVYTPEAATRSLEEVRDELRSTPLAGMQAVLEIAYRRVSPQARLLLAYLSVFKLSFSREQILVLAAPEMLAQANVPVRLVYEHERLNGYVSEVDEVAPAKMAENWREARDELVRASFVQFDGRVYTIHPQVRNFAFSHLPLEERRRLQRAIAMYYALLPQPAPEEWFVAFEHLECAGEVEDLQAAVRLAVRASWTLAGRGHATELLVMLRRAEVHATRIADKMGESQLLCCLGAILRQQGQYSEAEGYLKSSLEAFRQLHENVEAGWALYELALLAREGGNFRLANQYAQEGLTLFREAANSKGEAWMQFVLGEVSRGLGSYYEALGHFAEALTTFRALNDQEGCASILRDRGMVYEAFGQYKNALRDYEEAYRLFHESGLQASQGWVLIDQSVLHADMEQLDEAERCCNDAFALFHEQGVLRGEAWAMYMRGTILRARGKLEDARTWYSEALAMFTTAGDRVNQARVLNGLGATSYAEGGTQSAQGYYEQALSIARQQEARQLYGRTLRGLGDVARTLLHYAEAERYYQEALTIAKELDTPAEQGAVLRRMGEQADALGNYYAALDNWFQALNLDQRLEHPARVELEVKVNAFVREHHLEMDYAHFREQSEVRAQ